MTLIADIASGHTLLADWLFLIAGVFALLGAIAYAPKTVTPKLVTWAPTLVTLAVGLLAAAFLFL